MMLLLLFVHLIHVSLAAGNYRAALVAGFQKGGLYEFSFLNGNDSRLSFDIPVVSGAMFEEKINETGWSTLSVVTSSKFPDYLQAYWSGYLETNLTYDLTRAHFENALKDFCQLPLTSDCKRLQEYLSHNLQSMLKNAIQKADYDPYWYQMYLQLWQMKGISDAYRKTFIKLSTHLNHAYLKAIQDDVLGVYLLQIPGDLAEVITALGLRKLSVQRGAFGNMLSDRPSCSALIKLVSADIYLSHATWSDYSYMLRVLKHYRFPWKSTNHTDSSTIAGHTMTFSSYPSTISSVDDFYVLSSGLVTLETTIGNENASLWAYVRDSVNQSVLEPFRVMAANRLARTGKDWIKYFELHNSGTYNNQWMVYDSNRFTPGKPIPNEGLLMVAEQLPGIVVSDDVTGVLKQQTYWASYNIPYFPLIYNMSGFRALADKHGSWYSYNLTARAQIFRRDHHKVTNLAQMHQLMRYNDFKHDPLSRCKCRPPFTSVNAISSRNDLNDPNGHYPINKFGYRLHGATDVKIVNRAMINTLNLMATSGPTYSNMPPFQWSKVPIAVPKPLLHPDKWMFKPMLTRFADYAAVSHQRKESNCMYAMNIPTMIPVF